MSRGPGFLRSVLDRRKVIGRKCNEVAPEQLDMSGEHERLELNMHAARHDMKPELPGNHGQFGENVTTESYKPLRATQRVQVKPVVPRGGAIDRSRSPAGAGTVDGKRD